MLVRGDVRFGIVGCGRISTNSIGPAIHATRHAVLEGAASRDPSRAAQLSPRRVFESYDALIESPEIDALYVGTHNGLHHSQALKAIAAGKHVLCEKPLATNEKQCEDIVVAARQAGVCLAEAFMYRFHPQILDCAEALASGRIGELRSIEASFRFHMNQADDVRLRPEWGGGALLDVGCYCVNVSRLFLGDAVETVCAVGSRDPVYGIDTSIEASLTFNGNRRAALSCGFDGGLRQAVALIGTEGVIAMNEPFIRWEGSPTLTILEGRKRTQTTYDPVNPFELEIQDFVSAIRTGTPLRYYPEDAIGNARVLDRIRQWLESPACLPDRTTQATRSILSAA